MKRTVTTLAILASATQAFALRGPTKSFEACLDVYTRGNSSYASDCDQTENNKTLKKEINENGCAAKQIKIVSSDFQVPLCLPPNVVQL